MSGFKQRFEIMMDKADKLSMGMGVIKGGLEASKTLCENRERESELRKQTKEARVFLDNLTNKIQEIEKESASVLYQYSKESQDSLDALHLSQYNFIEKKKNIIVLLIVILCVVLVLLVAKIFKFFDTIRTFWNKFLVIKY